MDVVSLLRSKNRCLDRYLKLSIEFLAKAERGELEGISAFEQRRDDILRAMELFDRKVTEAVLDLSDSERTPELIENVKRGLAQKDDLVHRILAVDLKLIKIVEDEKNRLMKEINASRKTKDTIGKFKSTWIGENGQGLDETL